MPLPDVVSGLLLSVGSDVQVVSGTLKSIENTGFFNAFLFFVSGENLNPEDALFWIFVLSHAAKRESNTKLHFQSCC